MRNYLEGKWNSIPKLALIIGLIFGVVATNVWLHLWSILSIPPLATWNWQIVAQPIATFGTGIAAIIAATATLHNGYKKREQDKESALRDRLTTIVELLAETENLSKREAGAYAFDALADDWAAFYKGNLDAAQKEQQTCLKILNGQLRDPILDASNISVETIHFKERIQEIIFSRFREDNLNKQGKWSNLRLDVSHCHLYNLLADGIFNQQVSFFKTHFHKKADFSGAHFYDVTWFDEAHFHDDAGFDEAHFHDEVTFEKSIFHNAWFRKARFYNSGKFRGAHFRNDANFKETFFYEDAVFIGARFYRNAVFSSAFFKKDAQFRKVMFKQGASFKATRFGGDPELRSLQLNTKIWFEDAEFALSKYSDAINSLRDSGFDLEEAKFDVSFSGIK